MAGNISTLSASLSDKVGRPDSFGTSVYSYTIQENDNRRRMYQIIQAYIKGTREEASEEKVTEKSFSRFKSEKEEESNKARQNIFKEEIDLPSPAKSDLSLLKGKNTLTLLPERSYNDGIRLLQKGENQFEFAAFLLHSDEDVYLIDLIIDKLNTALHVMTGIDRDLICTEDDKYDDPWSYVSEKYMRYFERSAIVVSIVSDLNDVFHRSLTEVADALGKQIVLINVKGSDIKEPILKEFSNLSKVRFDFKKEFVQGTFETAWREFCTTIIQLVSNSGTRPMSYDGRNRSKSRDISRWGIQIYISHLTCSLPEHYITRLKREENTEFVACLLYGDDVEDEAFVRDIVLHKFNKILQRLTGVDRKLICSCAQSQLHWYDSEYERYMDRSSVVIVFLSKLFREDCLDWQLLQPRRRPEKKVVPMFFEAEEKYATPVIMGIHNLSEVRIVWKVENGQYVLKSSWLHVCNEILEHAAVFTLEQEMH